MSSLSRTRSGPRIASLSLAMVVLSGITAPLAGATERQGYTVRVRVGASGFEPRRVATPLGAVHFVVTAREGDHCFAIPTLDVEKRVRASRPLEVDVFFERAGEFPFLCCVHGSGSSETGVIVVAPAR